MNRLTITIDYDPAKHDPKVMAETIRNTFVDTDNPEYEYQPDPDLIDGIENFTTTTTEV